MLNLASSNQFGIPNRTDVFVVDNNGTLNIAWVVDGGGWIGPVPIGSQGLFPPGAAVAASNQFGISNQTDVFAVDNNGTLHVAFVVGDSGWIGPVAIVYPIITLRAVQNDGRFIEVNGTKFTPNQTVKLGYIIKGGNTSTSNIEMLTSNETGSFIFPIEVTLAGDLSSVEVEATDLASSRKTTALLTI